MDAIPWISTNMSIKVSNTLIGHHKYQHQNTRCKSGNATHQISHVVIVMGNPGVFQGYPYPYPRKPIPAPRVRVLTGQGKGFTKPGGIPTCAQVRHSNQPGNLTIALRVSNDTTMWYCEVGKVGSGENHQAAVTLLMVERHMGSYPSLGSRVRQRGRIGVFDPATGHSTLHRACMWTGGWALGDRCQCESWQWGEHWQDGEVVSVVGWASGPSFMAFIVGMLVG